MTVTRSVWKQIEDTPKGGRSRKIPLTKELAAALSAHRHLRGPYVLCDEGGARVVVSHLQQWIEHASKRAGLPVTRSFHILRHTFCSHLAMRGASVVAIQKLAGHANLSQTQRYMHLSPSDLDAAICLLDRGEGVEKASVARA